MAVCVLTRRFTGGLDSLESSPFATLSRGAFSASSLVTPTRADTSRDRVVPVCNTDSSLPTPPHTASGQERISPCPLASYSRGPLSLWTVLHHNDTYYRDYQTQASPLPCQRPAGPSPCPPPGLSPSQNPGQGQGRSPASAGGRPGPGHARPA